MREQIKKLMLGNGLAQLLQFGSILILSRIYQPSDFGLLAQIQSIAMVVSIVLTLQLHLTIPLSKNQDDALERVKNIQALCLRIFFAALIPAILCGEVVVYAIFLSLFLGFSNTYTGYLVHNGSFKKLSFFYVVRALLIIAMQIGFAFFEFENGLVIATLMGEAISAIYLGWRSIYCTEGNGKPSGNLKLFVLNNKQFSLYGTIQEIVSVSAFYVPLLLFSSGFGEDIGGQYAMASRLVWAPVILVSGSYAQALFHKFGKVAPSNNTEIVAVMPNMWIAITMLMVCGIAFKFNEITLFVIGDKWELASLMIPIQGIWGLIFFLSTPYRVLIRVFGIQKSQLLIDLVMMLAFFALPLVPGLMPISLLCIMVFIVIFQHLFLIKAVIDQMRMMKE